MPLNRVTVADPGEGVLACVQTSPISFVARVQQRTSARRQRGLRPRLIFRPNWGPEGQKNVRPPPLYLGVWMTGPHPPPPISRSGSDTCTGLYVRMKEMRLELNGYTNYQSRGGSSDFWLPTSDFRLPTSVAIKGGGRPTRLLPYTKMLLVSITFFSFCWVDCAIEGSTFFTEQMRF